MTFSTESLVMRSLAVATLVALLASPAFAQNATPPAGGAGMGQRRFQPPPNHWMTFDSLSQAIRQELQASGGGGFTPGQEPTPQQRARMDSVRTEMQGFQAEADQWYAAIRNNLTPDQQTKFDALSKPMVFRPMGGGPRQ